MMTEEEEKLARAYITCFSSDAGQAVLKDLQDKFYKRTFVVPPKGFHLLDPYSLAVNVGMREVVIYILSQIERMEYENGR